MSRCPDRETLLGLLDEEIGQDGDGELSRHVARCGTCQSILEILTGDGPEAAFAASLPAPSAAGSRSSFLSRLKQSAPVPASWAGREPLDGRRGRRPLPTVPGYEILRELGRGGMGVVYLARQSGLDRLVAIKMLRPGGDPQGRERFAQEAESVARLRHPNIVQVFGTGDAEGVPYLVLEFVEGGSLGDRLRGDPLPPETAACLIETLARAIHHAHLQGVVHRDLKPANVLLDGRGEGEVEAAAVLGSPTIRPRITDFGLAKRLDRPSTRTGHGDVLGTPCYMAPEQAGTSRNVGPAADVYALGAILYELLTGRPPFKGATAVETVLMVLHREPVRPRSLRPGLPHDLETICLACLAKDPARRYPTAHSLADDLARFLQGRPISARPVGLAERAAKWAWRHPLPVGLLACLLLVGAMGFGGVAWQWRLAAAARDTYLEEKKQKESERELAELAKEEADQQRQQARLLLYGSRIAQSQLSWRVNDIQGALAALEKCEPLPGQPDRRGWEWHYLRWLYRSEAMDLRHRGGGAGGAVAWSPAGGAFASVVAAPDETDEMGELRIWDSATGKSRLTIEVPGRMQRLAWSPDGKRLALAGGGLVLLLDAATGRESRRWRAHRDRISCVAFSPDGRALATGSWDGTARLWSARDGSALRAFKGNGHRIQHLDFHPTGDRLATASWDGIVRIHDTATGKPLKELRDHLGPAYCVAYSPDGRRLASSSRNGMVRLWDTATGRQVQSVTGLAGAVLNLAFSPDSRYLAYGGGDASVRVWDIERGVQRAVLRGHTSPVECVDFGTDGQTLVSISPSEGSVRGWDLTRSPESGRFARLKSDIGAVGFRDGGRQLVTLSAQGDLHAWDRMSGVPLAEVRLPTLLPPAGTAAAAFSFDGALLAAQHAEGEGRIGVWATPGGKLVLLLDAHKAGVARVCFSPNGKLLATAGTDQSGPAARHEVRVWDMQGRRRGTLTIPEKVVGLVFHHGGDWVAWGGEGGRLGLACWRTGRELVSSVRHRGAARALAFSPDGATLAVVGEEEQEVRLQTLLWKEGRPAWGKAQRLPALAGLCELAYSQDGKRLAGITRDLVKVWAPDLRMEMLTLRGVPQRYWDVPFAPRLAFSPEGLGLAATNWNESLSLWEAGPPVAASASLAGTRDDFWHIQEAERCLARRNAAAARFHLRLLKGHPLPAPVRKRMEAAKQQVREARP